MHEQKGMRYLIIHVINHSIQSCYATLTPDRLFALSLERTDWNVLMDGMDCITDVHFCTDVLPTKTNNKPWITSEIKALHKKGSL